ncbi:MAG: hypothetical protein HRU28_13460 [Rhizobiales bacterium]|nr:hypothetical protein [Hyphomicrobiales bacterium]
MKVTTPIYARAKTMAALLDIGVSTFLELVDSKRLPAGKKFKESSTSVKIWRVEEVCARIEEINSNAEIKVDPFEKAIRDGSWK